MHLLKHMNLSLPRYTSYPTAPMWETEEASFFAENAKRRNRSDPLSLYFHIPFCHSQCLYCGCSSIVNRCPEKERSYVHTLLLEMELFFSLSKYKPCVNQIHFGGGSPSKIEADLIEIIVQKVRNHCHVTHDAEIAIEVDPRTVFQNNFEKLLRYKEMGFTRVSIGCQDSTWDVQQAVHRHQPWALSKATYEKAKRLLFSSINIDLIYGLPLQTEYSFRETIERMKELQPDRIALFSYAHLPSLKPHQKALSEHSLPSLEEKYKLFLQARESLTHFGYTAIGLDHFASRNDPLSIHFHEGTLKRNFQGYTVLEGEDMVGFGVTSISQFKEGFFQNTKSLPLYQEWIQNGSLPTERGKRLSFDDQVRRYLIQSFMCRFSADFDECSSLFSFDSLAYFLPEIEKLSSLEAEGLLIRKGSLFRATEMGQIFIRNIASCLDAYLTKTGQRFSKAI